MAKDILGAGKSLEAIADLTKEVRELLLSLVGPSTAEVGQLLADKLKVRRLKTVSVMLQETKQILKEAGIEPKPVLLKTLFPILESASLEEDNELVKKWAGLLASAAASGSVHSSYPKILEQLSPEEARMLDKLAEWTTKCVPELSTWSARGYSAEALSRHVGLPDPQFQVAAENLERLGLWRPMALGEDSLFWSPPLPSISHPIMFSLTALGLDFVNTCCGPQRNQ